MTSQEVELPVAFAGCREYSHCYVVSTWILSFNAQNLVFILSSSFSLSYVSPFGHLSFGETMNPRTHRSVTRCMAFWMVAWLASGWIVPSFAESPNPSNSRVYRTPIDDLNAIREHLLLADPTDRGHLRFLTLAHLVKLNKLDEAMVHLNRATRHEERLARAYYEKAELYVLQGNREAALVELDKAIQYEPNDTVYALRRQVLVRVSR